MDIFALEIWNDETRKVTFYTVRWADAEYSEMDKFLLRVGGMEKMKQPLQELLYLITDVIGNAYGAREEFFSRFENRVTALPPKSNVAISTLRFDYKDFPLRLYCLVLSEEIVILFSGGVKNSRSVQESSDVIAVKFYEANEFARKILDALNSEEIYVDGNTLRSYTKSKEIYL